jgi:TetR/AcrR family transcriptional regulator
MDEIALEAEVTKPTIYLYFQAKINDSQSMIAAIFKAFNAGYETYPDAFHIIQLFQQQRLMNELRPEVRIA